MKAVIRVRQSGAGAGSSVLTWTARGIAVAATAFLLSLAGCGTSRMASADRQLDQLAALPDATHAIIQMRRGGCAPGVCPVYSLSVSLDGTVDYDGRANVAVVGQRHMKLSPDRVSDLISKVEAMRFLDSADHCCVCPNAEVSQLVIVDYRPGGVAHKSVVHDDICLRAPPALTGLEQAIDSAANIDQWIKPPVLAQASTPPAAPTATPAPAAAPVVTPSTAAATDQMPPDVVASMAPPVSSPPPVDATVVPAVARAPSPEPPGENDGAHPPSEPSTSPPPFAQ